MIIRNAKLDDLRQVSQICIDNWKTVYRGIIDDDYLDNLSVEENYKKRINDYNEIGFIVAEEENEILGFCRYRTGNAYPEKDLDINCEICALYVKPKFKNQGIGSKLVKYVKKEFKESGYNKMIIWCLKENYSARKFYEKNGGKYVADNIIKRGRKDYKEVGYVYELQKRYANKNIGGKFNKNIFKKVNVNSEDFIGDICFYEFHNVEQEKIPNGLIIIDDDYKWLEFYDYNAKVKLTAIYDDKNEIVEWYFDIAKEIGNEDGIPYEYDMYLDVVVTGSNELILLDEDELGFALEKGSITKEEYNEAYSIAQNLMNKLNGNFESLKGFTDKYLEKMLKEEII